VREVKGGRRQVARGWQRGMRSAMWLQPCRKMASCLVATRSTTNTHESVYADSIVASAPSPVTPIAIHDHSPLPGFMYFCQLVFCAPPRTPRLFCPIKNQNYSSAARSENVLKQHENDLVCERVSTPMGDIAVCSAA